MLISFQKIEAVARHVRKNDRPFGGIQLILCGDFLQLPPVSKVVENSNRFCFQTEIWNTCVHRYFELEQVHRQVDQTFIDILNSIRIGKVTDEISNKLLATSKKTIEQNGILATRLCSHTNDANIINESKLNALSGAEMTFLAQDSDAYISKQLDQQLTVPGKLVLKVGAQVMLLKNINIGSGLVNGARGVIKEFKEGLPVVQFRSILYTAKQEKWSVKTAGGAVLTRKQVPLKLAWAFSIHKSQGLTLDCVEMSLAKVFEAGQAYVALSRAQSLETLRVLDFKASQVWADPVVLKFYKRLKSEIECAKKYPVNRPLKSISLNKPVHKSKPINKKLFSSAPLVSIS